MKIRDTVHVKVAHKWQKKILKIRKYFETYGNKLPHVKFLEKEIFSLEKNF